MAEIGWNCGISFAAEQAQTVPASGILDVSAFDTTRLALSSTGPSYLVNSLGSEPNIFRIVRWVNGAYLVNSAALALRGGASRGVVTNDISIFHSDANGNFVELVYAPVTAASEPTYTGRLIGTSVYAADATVTVPDGAGQGKGRITGGAGGSGGAQAYSGGDYNAASGGSGAPGYSEFLLTGLIPGNTLTFTVGAGGTAGAGGGATVPTAGGNGTASTLASGTQTISTITANGSNGTGAALSSGSPSLYSYGTPGGTSSGGYLNMTGQPGSDGSVSGSTYYGFAGAGGSTMLAQGTAGVNSHGLSAGNSIAGNPGAGGLLIIDWYT